MRLVTGTRSVRVALAGLAVLGVAGMAVPVAAADPVLPGEPEVPIPQAAPPAPVADAGAPAAVAQAAAPAPITPAEGTSHLPSPDSLPPGTTQIAPEHSTLDYLKDVWKALRTEDVSASDALLLLAQRPINNAKAVDSVPQSQTDPAAPPPVVPAPAAPMPAAAG